MFCPGAYLEGMSDLQEIYEKGFKRLKTIAYFATPVIPLRTLPLNPGGGFAISQMADARILTAKGAMAFAKSAELKIQLFQS